MCALHYSCFTFGAAYLVGLSLHVLYIFIKLAPHLTAACGTTLLAFPTHRGHSKGRPLLRPGLLPGWFPCCLACHGRCLAYCTCLAPSSWRWEQAEPSLGTNAIRLTLEQDNCLQASVRVCCTAG